MGGVARESEPARRHRFALRTADKVDLVLLHAQALDELGDDDRVELLRALTDVVAAGGRTTPDEALKMARRFVLAEKRQPGVVLAALDPGARERLASAFLRQAGTAVLLRGYDTWDGREPSPPDAPPWVDRETSRDERRRRVARAHGLDPYSGGPMGG